MESRLKGPTQTIQVSSHSHITGLGLDENGKARRIGGGLVGQEEAREAAGIVVELVKEGRLAGKGVLLAGPPGTGKTAIAIAIARELGADTPFVAMNASEIYSVERKKTEVLLQAIRRAIGVRVVETRRVLEGMVASIKYVRKRSPFSPYPTLAGARIVLETKDDSLELTRVPPEVAAQLYQLRVREGDVIVIDAETLEVKKLGRAKGRGKKLYDLEVEQEVEIPEGPVEKTKQVVRTFTLHDVDLSIAAQRAIFTGLFAVFGGEREISDEVRKKTDELVKKMIDEGKAELVPGVLFIDDAHLLDIEAFGFLTKAMESEFAPLIILATNRGITKIKGTDVESPHGMPRDLLDRLLIIPTRPYTEDEIRDIIRIRSDELEVPLTEEAIEELTKIGSKRSLRYALQLLDPAWMIAKRRGARAVEPDDVKEAERLFADLKESVSLVEKYKDLMMV
ncbi:MAG: RuvB-like helicase [Desulfurococcales archaeon]|nr:RuvB-like helicase [Desulfurococcales archaeon]MCE4622350.1 RuvB-like helicase [Desulfurococcales archaeon]MCE4626633.1 RuvB-like helicase [Desulfurococcales archaeon]MCE4628999.1 RuvB-like helicase [Desulfurococcales archaeon]